MKGRSAARLIAKAASVVVLLIGGWIAWQTYGLWSSAHRASVLCDSLNAGVPEGEIVGRISSANGARLLRAPDELIAEFGKCSCYVALSRANHTVEKAVSDCRR
jgi:hypothetical protein